MNVVIAPALGFCRGVERALAKAEEALSSACPVFLLGDIVHNSHVKESLRGKGAVTVEDAASIPQGATVVVRAHGIPDSERKILEEKDAVIADATCPVVLLGQEKVRSSSLPVVVLGNPGHPETLALLGSGRGKVFLVSRASELSSLPPGDYTAVVQTTFSSSQAEKIISEAHLHDVRLFLSNRICPSSEKRRAGLEAILPEVDAVVVVGDSKSANTRELAALAGKRGKKAFLVADSASLPREVFSYGTVGLTAGASTPRELYIEVKKRLEEI